MQHGIHLADNVAGIIMLLLIAATTLAISKRIQLPFSVLLVVVGIVFATLIDTYPDNLHFLQGISLSPDLILYVFLPTLIFESAYNLDARQLWHNLLPVLTLAVPGLLISTVIIGTIVHLATPIPFVFSLLLGAILSATDPVAVISLFKRLGAPERLTILVEGESLFNDATAIVLAKILLLIAIAGTDVQSNNLFSGVSDFFIVFLGGLFVGALLGWLTGLILGAVHSDPSIEITLTTILAYASFLIAEEWLHVSGVVATVAAGLMLGSWGKFKVSASVRSYVHHFWDYMGFVATALIFLMVGMRVEFTAMINSADILGWVLLAMLLSRILVVYGLIPLVNRLPRSQITSRAYQTVMVWGGLRGAIALAIVLSLPNFPYHDLFVAVTMGAVLFTLLVQGLTMEWLVHKLGLDKPPLADQVAQAIGDISANKHALLRLPELHAGGQFDEKITKRLKRQCEKALQRSEHHLASIRNKYLTDQDEINLITLRCFAIEQNNYIALFNKGHISESALRDMLPLLSLQIESIRYQAHYHSVELNRLPRRRAFKALIHLFTILPGLSGLAEKLRLRAIAHEYEMAWAHVQAGDEIIDYLKSLEHEEKSLQPKIDSVLNQYKRWHEYAKTSITQMKDLYPEFVYIMQERHGQRLILLAEMQSITRRADRGEISASVAQTMLDRRQQHLWKLSNEDTSSLVLTPGELLYKVPFCKTLSKSEFNKVASHMKSLSLPANEVVIKQGGRGDSLYLLARGQVQVSREEGGQHQELAILSAGDFFGEMSLLHDISRSATVKTLTPCSLYSLKRRDLDQAMLSHPGIRAALEQIDQARQGELDHTPFNSAD